MMQLIKHSDSDKIKHTSHKHQPNVGEQVIFKIIINRNNLQQEIRTAWKLLINKANFSIQTCLQVMSCINKEGSLIHLPSFYIPCITIVTEFGEEEETIMEDGPSWLIYNCQRILHWTVCHNISLTLFFYEEWCWKYVVDSSCSLLNW